MYCILSNLNHHQLYIIKKKGEKKVIIRINKLRHVTMQVCGKGGDATKECGLYKSWHRDVVHREDLIVSKI